MIVKLMKMRPDFYFNYHIIQYHSKHGKGDVILRGPTILDSRCIYMPVLIGVGGGPTLGQHEYNRAYFQTPDCYTCQKHFGDVIFKVYYFYCKLFGDIPAHLYQAPCYPYCWMERFCLIRKPCVENLHFCLEVFRCRPIILAPYKSHVIWKIVSMMFSIKL